jgi:membrane protein YqaA with SNARE-associated domain
MWYKIFTITLLSTFEIYAAIPMGFAFKLPALTIFIACTIGGIIGVVVAAFLGEKIEHWLAKFRKAKPKEKKPNLAHKLMEKYGVIGLGLLGTITVGAPVSIAVGVGFNVPMYKLGVWCTLGVIIRCALFTTLGHFGMQLF